MFEVYVSFPGDALVEWRIVESAVLREAVVRSNVFIDVFSDCCEHCPMYGVTMNSLPLVNVSNVHKFTTEITFEWLAFIGFAGKRRELFLSS